MSGIKASKTPKAKHVAPATYAAAGVNVKAGNDAVERMKKAVSSTYRAEVLGGLGSFGGLFAPDFSTYKRPVLVSSTDGVGTKMLVAKAMGRYDTIGIDLVAMCVDDLVCEGAEPLFFLDYISIGALVPQIVESLVSGIAKACAIVGCALLGGETAEHPGAMEAGDIDAAGFAVGVVDDVHRLGANKIETGDVLIGLPSPGLRSNGYSLARHVLFERAGLEMDDPAYGRADHSIGEELLRPSVLYSPWVLDAIKAAPSQDSIHACAHITGGGIANNLLRVLPEHLDAIIETSAWERPPIFDEIARLGNVRETEMRGVFNLGVGMIVVVSRQTCIGVLETFKNKARNLDISTGLPGVIGRIGAGQGKVNLK